MHRYISIFLLLYRTYTYRGVINLDSLVATNIFCPPKPPLALIDYDIEKLCCYMIFIGAYKWSCTVVYLYGKARDGTP